MHTRWPGCLVFSLSASVNAFVSSPLVRTSCLQPRSPQGLTLGNQQCTSRLQALPTTGETVDASMGVNLEEISNKRLYVEFAAFGFYTRECQLELKENGDCEFSKGMVANIGAWRIEEEEGTEYLQFSCPLTELYSEIFFVPSGLLYWRVPLRKGQDGKVILKDGQIISERNQFFGLRQTFIDEGTFKARILGDDEEFPTPVEIDVSDIEVPEGLVPRKKKKGKGAPKSVPITEQISEPPLTMPEDSKRK